MHLPKNKLTIVFFIGSDITSHLIFNAVYSLLIGHGHTVCAFFAPYIPKAIPLKKLAELYFFERELLNNYLYPLLNTLEKSDTVLKTPEQLAKISDRLIVKTVENINSPDTLLFLKDHRVSIGISLRCYQKFSKEMINFFSKNPNHYLLNLHPGLLPQYRGVTTYCRAMNNGDKKAGFTLHHIDEQWDAGPIVARSSLPLDYSTSVLENMITHRSIGIKLILKAINAVENRKPLHSRPQSKNYAHYYSHPNQCDIFQFKKKGIELVRSKEFFNLVSKHILCLNQEKVSQLRSNFRESFF